jgi:glyoxylase-like metal-dependent hydrolase (beta-lactamase superfamily II)
MIRTISASPSPPSRCPASASTRSVRIPDPQPRIDREIGDGDELGFGDGAVAVAVPGHTPGSVAVYLPRHQVLFTGDAAARRPDGTVICGVSNVDRAEAAASLRRLAGLGATVACFGHGEPLTHAAAAGLQAAAARHMPSGTGQDARDTPGNSR